jgi:CHC2 zinc finger/Toprim domain
MIAPALLDELRARVPVSEVVGRRVRLSKAGLEWKGLSPFNKERSPSFFVNDQKGFYHDFSSGKHGDIFAFVMETEGVAFPEAVERHTAAPTPARTAAATRDKAGRVRALGVWEEAGDLGGTVSAEYLAGRKLDLPEGMSGRVLRHHPRCPWRNEADELVIVPALIVLFRDVRTDEPTAILRRALTADGRKIGKPRYLGPMAGCAVKLTANDDVCQGLNVGEGVETMLAAMMLGFAPAWALGGTGNLQAFPVLAGIDALTIIVDHDANGAGQKAAMECSNHWTTAGREVWRVVPDQVGDMNDLVEGGDE